jgi:hypothetical protein
VKAAILVEAGTSEPVEVAAEKALLSCPSEEHELYRSYVTGGGQKTEEQFNDEGRAQVLPVVIRRIEARRQVLKTRQN